MVLWLYVPYYYVASLSREFIEDKRANIKVWNGKKVGGQNTFSSLGLWEDLMRFP